MTTEKQKLWFRNSSRALNLTSVEAEIMRVVWDNDRPVAVRDVYETLRERKQIAYTTVMSVMNKLAQKGFLLQDKSTTAYLYTAAFSDAEVAGSMMDSIIEKVLGGAAEPMISRLLGSKRKLTPEQLEKLEQLLDKKKNR